MTKLLVIGAVLWLSAASRAQHVVPPLVNYQGRLLDSSGTNAANGNYEIAFRIWSAGNAGTLVWGRTYPVTVNSGVFNVVLGEGGSDLPGAQVTDIRQAFTDRERYLGISVTKDRGVPVPNPQEIVPRQQFLSTPFALAADDAGSLGGLPPAAYALVGGNDSLAAKSLTVTNLTVQGQFKAQETVGGGFVPVGGIIMWGGSVAEVPSGWVLCDGRSWKTADGQDRKAPDLRNQFVLGWGTRNPGAQGGAETHALAPAEMPAHGHSFSFNTVGYTSKWNGSSEAMGSPATGRNNSTQSRTTDQAGSGAAFSIMPPYYVLAFIQRTR